MRLAYESAWKREFAARLRIGRIAQAGLFNPLLARAGLAALGVAPWLGRMLIRATRGRAETGMQRGVP